MDVRHLPLKNIITQSRKLPCPTPCPRLPVKRSIAHGTPFYMRGSHPISAPLPRRKLSSRSSWHYGCGLVSAPIRGTPYPTFWRQQCWTARDEERKRGVKGK